jgi:hypothetical protein
MLARLALLFVMLPTLALAASADVLPNPGKLVTPPPAKPDPVVSAAAEASIAAPTPAVAYEPPTPPAADPSECRMQCAQSLYFCSAGGNSEDCSPAWTKCVATCTAPELNPTASTAP